LTNSKDYSLNLEFFFHIPPCQSFWPKILFFQFEVVQIMIQRTGNKLSKGANFKGRSNLEYYKIWKSEQDCIWIRIWIGMKSWFRIRIKSVRIHKIELTNSKENTKISLLKWMLNLRQTIEVYLSGNKLEHCLALEKMVKGTVAPIKGTVAWNLYVLFHHISEDDLGSKFFCLGQLLAELWTNLYILAHMPYALRSSKHICYMR